jgi:hypothetical protein
VSLSQSDDFREFLARQAEAIVYGTLSPVARRLRARSGQSSRGLYYHHIPKARSVPGCSA